MTTPFDRDRPAPQAPGRLSAAPADFAPQQPVAFSAASLRETGETPAEAARRLGMIDPAFLRASREPAAGAPAAPPVEAREPAPFPPRQTAEPALFARREPSPDAMLAPTLETRPTAPAVEPPPLAVTRAPAAPVEPAVAYAIESDAPVLAPADAPERGDLASRAAGFVGTVGAFIRRMREKRAEARASEDARLMQAAPAEAGAAPARPQKLTAKEKRWRRRRRRMVFEEAIGWVLVPVIVVGLYYAMIGGLALFGMSLDDLVAGLQVAWAQLR